VTDSQSVAMRPDSPVDDPVAQTAPVEPFVDPCDGGPGSSR
jgi:hypothetical protein